MGGGRRLGGCSGGPLGGRAAFRNPSLQLANQEPLILGLVRCPWKQILPWRLPLDQFCLLAYANATLNETGVCFLDSRVRTSEWDQGGELGILRLLQQQGSRGAKKPVEFYCQNVKGGATWPVEPREERCLPPAGLAPKRPMQSSPCSLFIGQLNEEDAMEEFKALRGGGARDGRRRPWVLK